MRDIIWIFGGAIAFALDPIALLGCIIAGTLTRKIGWAIMAGIGWAFSLFVFFLAPLASASHSEISTTTLVSSIIGSIIATSIVFLISATVRKSREKPKKNESLQDRKTKFEQNQTYTREEIHKALGGGAVSYLPSVDNVITCICLDKKLNPKAPNVILPGTGKQIEAKAEWLSRQQDALPAFVKFETNKWQYRGKYKVVFYSKEKQYIDYYSKQTSRDDITSVIKLRKQLHSKTEENIPNDGRTRCLECGTPYDLNDYREGAKEIFCSTCKEKLN